MSGLRGLIRPGGRGAPEQRERRPWRQTLGRRAWRGWSTERGTADRPAARTRAGADTSAGAGADLRAGDGAGDGVGADAGTAPQPDGVRPSPRTVGPGLRAWVELLRLPALFTVPGDALAGAAAAGARPNSRTLLAIGSSLCLYEAGMALNDWADRAEDAVDRPHRPLPSGRIRPAAALAAAGGLTAAGLALASRAGRRPLAVAGALAATVWSYDLVLKRTPAGPLAMAAARGLDLLLGGVAAGGDTRKVVAPALTLATHTLAVTTVSRHETRGGSPWAPLTALATTTALTWSLTRAGRTGDSRTNDQPPGHTPTTGGDTIPRQPASRASAFAPPSFSGTTSSGTTFGTSSGKGTLGGTGFGAAEPNTAAALGGVLAAVYAVTFARPLFHAALNPSPPLTQRAVGGGIRAMIPLQAALAARSGAPVTALLTVALAPAARRFSRKVSVT
ncbi:SCO3242 family prenyltransferase [Streptomyces sp. NPDC020802]|uniref:SCO3242 family prenyltransferase n=1 Tax=Streptomyces sp. NPDC020802 TaxID=3365094 RepID=UPI00379CFD3C